MSDFSAERIQSAAEEVRRSDFGDFMFRNPGFGSTTHRNTTKKNTARNQHTSSSSSSSSSSSTTQRNTTRHRNPCRNPRNWHTTTRGNQQISTCWDDGNMWELRIKQT